MSNSEPSTVAPTTNSTCPVCAEVVDPRRTSQAIARPDTVLLFCSSSCLRQFVAAEQAARKS